MKLAISLAMFLLLISCGKKSSGGKDQMNPSIQSPLIGRWYSGCIAGGGGSQNLTFIFTTTTFSLISTIHSDPTCTSLSMGERTIYNYTYDEVGEDLTVSQTNIFFTYNIPSYITDLNDPTQANGIYCGEKDWVLNVEKEVTDKNCSIGSTASGGMQVVSLRIINANSIEFQGLVMTKQ